MQSSIQKLQHGMHTYGDIRNGTMVKIVYKQGSIFNYYKGYIGEVKDYKRGHSHARVLLHAPSYPCIIRVPLDHFVKLEDLKSNQ